MDDHPEWNEEETRLAWNRATLPSAQTIFRMRILSSARSMVADVVAEMSPLARERDQGTIARINRAETAEEIMDLAAVANGLADPAWYDRLPAFVPEIAPLIGEWLKTLPDSETRSSTYEHLLSALGFCGDAGIQALLVCFDALSDYGKSLACIALGHLGAHASADKLWAFYQGAVKQSESFFIGPLWGLVDMEDPRAADALADLLSGKRLFYEAFAMAYKIGDARLVRPLMILSQPDRGELGDSARWALGGLAHRIGRDALLAEIQQIMSEVGATPEEAQSLTDVLYQAPRGGADAYFRVFYRGMEPSMIDQEDLRDRMKAMQLMAPMMDGDRLPERVPAPPGLKPGRNDPCWCGSGVKYKRCHWRPDRDHRESI
jgi:hypothetical protein